MRVNRKTRRTFGTAFKKGKVDLLDSGKITARELSLIYEVSDRAIYNWIRNNSKNAATEHVVVQKVPEASKNIELMKRIRDLEQSLGRKQFELDLYKPVVDIINEKDGVF
ncbi:MAG: hypothetical protein GXO88_14110 [Chlorobi bacterium]|nr:hypothetical protein [Chlorobiota bacterium]